MRIILYAFLAYLLYQLIFNLAIPLIRTTRRLRKGFREMNERVNQARSEQPPPQQAKQAPAEDYIDFEEIR